MAATADDFLRISAKSRVLPIIHGSGDFAVRVREEMLARTPDCLAVPLPPSFRAQVEEAVGQLPLITAVVQRDEGSPEGEDEGFSYVPIDPCQGVIAAIRLAIGERVPRAFIDLETPWFDAGTADFPDPYALKKVSPAAFAAAILPAVGPPATDQTASRCRHMARQLRRLERTFSDVLLVCSILDWPWIREAYRDDVPAEEAEDFSPRISTHVVAPRTLPFFLGELPFLTALYERGRIDLTADDNLSVDGMKEMVLAARDHLKKTHPRRAARLTPQALSLFLKYVRNLRLIDRRLTPDLHTLAVAAQQIAGDDFALSLVEVSRSYPFVAPERGPRLRMGIDMADVPSLGMGPMANRLPGQSMTWGTLRLRKRPDVKEQRDWQQRWNPWGQCSWPPEDERIESFTAHVRDQARALIGADLARSEKFTTSVMDGLDIRETLRHWHTGDIYVKVIPPDRGTVEVVVFLFDTPADPRKYTFRTTWFAEHANESTLAFFATNPMEDLVGPGVARAEYGGAMFVWPPRPIEDIWTDEALDVADTLEERLLAAALHHSREKHVAVVSPRPPGPTWRKIAARAKRKILHLPLSRFNGQMIERLRTFHVLNGKQVRSYAADFIREM